MMKAVLICLGLATGCAGAAPEPTLADVRYGTHERHVLDLWKAESARPSPVLIFFHGGGFRGGDKRSFAARAPEFLRAGISVVSANYRYSSQAIYPGPMVDGARVVEFVRSKAKEWNIDPAKVAVSGSSAGANIALWIALREGAAKPRVSCALVWNSPTSMDPLFIEKYMGATDLGAMLKLYGVESREELLRPEKRKQTLDASMIELATPDDPPIYLTYAGDLTPTPLAPGARFGEWIHHPRFGELMKEKCDRIGLECHFYHRGKPAPEGAEVAFLQKCFGGKK